MGPSAGNAILTAAIALSLLATIASLGYLAVVAWRDWATRGPSERVRRGLCSLTTNFAAMTGTCWIAARPAFDWSDYLLIGAGVGIAAARFPRKTQSTELPERAASRPR